MRLLLRFASHIFFEELENRRTGMLAREHVLPLHLSLRRLPFMAHVMRMKFLKNQEVLTVKGLIDGVDKDTGTQIYAPSFGGMLHIGVGLLGIKGEMFGTP